MQIAIISLIVLVAVALVLAPLVRRPRGAGAGDLDPLHPPSPGGKPRVAGGGGAGPGVDAGEIRTAGVPPESSAQATSSSGTSPEPGLEAGSAEPAGEADAEELPQVAPGPPGPVEPPGGKGSSRAAGSGRKGDAGSPAATSRVEAAAGTAGARVLSPTEEEILRYREAVRAGTVCPFCSMANPAGSKYCMECGGSLATAEAGHASGDAGGGADG